MTKNCEFKWSEGEPFGRYEWRGQMKDDLTWGQGSYLADGNLVVETH